MKQYVIDEIRPSDHVRLKAYLEAHCHVSGFDGLYHIPLPGELLDGFQIEHDDCRPYYFALELLPDRLVCELLVRTHERVRCDCMQYASAAQRDWLIRLVDDAFNNLGIIT